jgi:hypothetical protein
VTDPLRSRVTRIVPCWHQSGEETTKFARECLHHCLFPASAASCPNTNRTHHEHIVPVSNPSHPSQPPRANGTGNRAERHAQAPPESASSPRFQSLVRCNHFAEPPNPSTLLLTLIRFPSSQLRSIIPSSTCPASRIPSGQATMPEVRRCARWWIQRADRTIQASAYSLASSSRAYKRINRCCRLRACELKLKICMA